MTEQDDTQAQQNGPALLPLWAERLAYVLGRLVVAALLVPVALVLYRGALLETTADFLAFTEIIWGSAAEVLLAVVGGTAAYSFARSPTVRRTARSVASRIFNRNLVDHGSP